MIIHVAVFLTVIFHKIVLRHVSGVVGHFVITLLEIYRRHGTEMIEVWKFMEGTEMVPLILLRTLASLP